MLRATRPICRHQDEVRVLFMRALLLWEDAVAAFEWHKHEHEVVAEDHRPKAETIRARREALERRAWRCATFAMAAATTLAKSAKSDSATLPRQLVAWVAQRLDTALRGHPIACLNRAAGSKQRSPAQIRAITAAVTYEDLCRRGHVPDPDPEKTIKEIFWPGRREPRLPTTWQDWKDRYPPTYAFAEEIDRELSAGAEGGVGTVARIILERHAVQFNAKESTARKGR